MPTDSTDREEFGSERGGRSGSRTTRLVDEAATILDEELVAAGIDRARNIEDRLFGTRQRRRDSRAALPRLRRDAHEIIDLAADLLDDAIGLFDRSTAAAVVIRDDTPASDSDARPVPAKVASGAAGGSVSVPVTVENDSGQPVEDFELFASNLMSPTGDIIPAERIAFEPRMVTVPSHQAEEIDLRIEVPAETPPGSYSGVLQAAKIESVRVVLVVNVV
jgi:hypothetical protein